jgi:hypothetical protein
LRQSTIARMTVYTIASLEQTILENADWHETGSVSKAKAFATAIDRLLFLSPESSSDQGTSLSLGRATWEKRRDAALEFIAAASANNRSTLFLSVGQQFRR